MRPGLGFRTQSFFGSCHRKLQHMWRKVLYRAMVPWFCVLKIVRIRSHAVGDLSIVSAVLLEVISVQHGHIKRYLRGRN
jgi:hypothetical protein